MKFLFLFAIVFSNSLFAAELVKLNDFLKVNLAGSSKMTKESFTLNSDQITRLKKVATDAQDTSMTFYFGKSADQKLQKACTVVPQKGKEGPMTVGVCFDPLGLITEVAVLSHEEERGRKATENKDFLNKFKGKKPDNGDFRSHSKVRFCV
jgi:hypothetical protein